MRKPSFIIIQQVGLFSSQAKPVSLEPVSKGKATGSGVSLSCQILVNFRRLKNNEAYFKLRRKERTFRPVLKKKFIWFEKAPRWLQE